MTAIDYLILGIFFMVFRKEIARVFIFVWKHVHSSSLYSFDNWLAQFHSEERKDTDENISL